jgi:excisionase family DNA binding protein
MITVPEAARRIGRNPETVRRWIREGRLPAQRVGTQHLVGEQDLAALTSEQVLPLPPGWERTVTGEPMPDWVGLIRRSRAGR